MLDRLVAGRAPDAAITSTDYFVAAGGKALAIHAGLLQRLHHSRKRLNVVSMPLKVTYSRNIQLAPNRTRRASAIQSKAIMRIA